MDEGIFTMKNTSTARHLHDLLVNSGPSFKAGFTSSMLKAEAIKAGIEGVTDGAVSGFIHKLVLKDRGIKSGKMRDPGTNRIVNVYAFTDHEPWAFKQKSIGSLAGRTVVQSPRPVPQQSLFDMLDAPAKEKSLFQRFCSMSNEILELETKSLSDVSTKALMDELTKRLK
jgi:hypothetical protein